MGHAKLKDPLRALARDARNSLRDLTPIIVVIGVFQAFIIRQPVDGLMSIVVGGLLVFVGLTFFIFGLRLALFPVGEGLAHSLARPARRRNNAHEKLIRRRWALAHRAISPTIISSKFRFAILSCRIFCRITLFDCLC